ncbi:MAG TPA: ABC transporter ATP-binding protein [Acidimicrobiales bacterium]
MADAGAELRVEGLTLRFAGSARAALDRVELDVDPGEIVAVLGPSGCGKTTLLRVVAGLTAADAGRVTLDGRDLTAVPVHRRGVGLMFQDYALFPHRDVGGNVEFGLRMAGKDDVERRARVSEVLGLVGLAGWERRAVGPLSGGERQRVALARALAPEPSLLLLDEPIGALDRTLRDRLVPELGELFRTVGVSVVYVTHDQGEALALADRIVVMDQGTVVQEGRPAELWSRPATAFVARFLGFANVMETADGPVLIRPEAVHLTRPTGAGEGVVTSVTFRGDHSVVRLLRHDGEVLDAHVATSSGEKWSEGDHVDLTVDPSGVQFL